MHTGHFEFDADDSIVDFKNASLYIVGLQVLVSLLACATTSILACWLLPPQAVSAVRTVTLTSIVGLLCVRKPLRLGNVHGLQLVFNALRPSIGVYILCLILEQLVHGCANDPTVTPNWRRVVFQAAIIAMLTSGFMRARAPLAMTDAPFLITALSMLVVAMLPPPAVAMAGPLCEPVSLFGAAERMVRALCFACVYIVFVYCSAPPTAASSDIMVCLCRASAASVWTLGAALPLLTFSLPQCAVAIWARLKEDDSGSHMPLVGGHTSTLFGSSSRYNPLATKSPTSCEADVDEEAVHVAVGAVASIANGHQPSAFSPPPKSPTVPPSQIGSQVASQLLSINAPRLSSGTPSSSCNNSGFRPGPLSFREVGGGGPQAQSRTSTHASLEEVAARLEREAESSFAPEQQ